jgi:hypothetical protein
MSKHQTGARNGQWKGGRSVASNGYVLFLVGREHHLADVRGYAYEHRIVAEAAIGRMLRPGEQVNHINGVKTDNRPKNLQVVASIAEHRAAEGRRNFSRRVQGEPNPEIDCACGCGVQLLAFDASGRRRRYVSGHNMRSYS